MRSCDRVLLGVLVLLVSAIAIEASASSVETFVMAVGGKSMVGPDFSCATFGPATTAFTFFINASVAVPTDGLAPCGIAGEFRTTTAAAGPISDTTSLSTSFNAEPNTFSGSASAHAQSGIVGAEAHGTFTGSGNGLIVEGATSYAIFTESLNASSSNVTLSTPGTVRFTFSVDGSLSGNNNDVEFNYSLDGGPSYILMRAQTTGAGATPGVATGSGAPLPGFTLAPGSFSGADTIDSFDLPFTWGTPFDLKFGLMAVASPTSGATADVDFASTATLTGIQLFANGQPITDFTLASGSGTPYDANGVHAVPEPSSLSLMLAGATALAIRSGRRHAH